MSPRAIHLADVLGAQLAELGPGVRALSVDECSTWHLVKIGTADGAVLQRLADDPQLDQARTGPRLWWRRMLPRPSAILFLASNPQATQRLALDEEARVIEQELERVQHRDRLELVPKLAPRAMELRRHLQVLKPVVVHFSGHGTPDGLLFHDDSGTPRVVTREIIGELFRLAEVAVRIVVLNACFSEGLAEGLLEHVDCVVGMCGPIPDESAKAFAVGFYEALGDRASVRSAYDVGCLAMKLLTAPPGGHSSPGSRDIEVVGPATEEGGDCRLPVLRLRSGLDASALFLAEGPE